MFLVSINMSIFHFSLSKKFLQLLVLKELNMNFYMFGGKKIIFNLCFVKKIFFF